MEEVKRQFGQHIAVEPEWEAGFSLQIQLRHTLAMFQDWCSSDVSCHIALHPSNHSIIPQLVVVHLLPPLSLSFLFECTEKTVKKRGAYCCCTQLLLMFVPAGRDLAAWI